MAKKKKSRAGFVCIPCDGLATQEDGWVEFHAYLKTGHTPYAQGLDLEAIQKAIDAEVSPFDDEFDALVERKEKALRVIFRILSAFVVDWNWKDPKGNPYPKPHRNIQAIENTHPGEFEWLFDQLVEIIGEEEVAIPKSSDTPS